MYRMRRWFAPFNVTSPPPSMTMSGPVLFTILAVASSVIVMGLGPQRNVMMPPSATVLTTAADVQLAGVPFPMTWVGFDVSATSASGGTTAAPPGLPGSTGAGGTAQPTTPSPIAATSPETAIRSVFTGWVVGATPAPPEPFDLFQRNGVVRRMRPINLGGRPVCRRQ